MRCEINLWNEWSKAFSSLEGAFSRKSTFLWATILCAGFSIRSDKSGLTNMVDRFGLAPRCYHALLRSVQSHGINLDLLLSLWVNLCFRLFKVCCIDGYMVVFGDGVKIPKEGRKMPAVKLMHQSSNSNSKAPFIMGHSIQSLSLAVYTQNKKIAAVPIVSEIHEGIKFTNRDKRTVHSKMTTLVKKVSQKAEKPIILVADAYYANRSIIASLQKAGGHLVTRVARHTVAFIPAQGEDIKKRGRSKIKGEKVILRDLFDQLDTQDGPCHYKSLDLYWSSAKGIVRFVVCQHDEKGKIILMTTN